MKVIKVKYHTYEKLGKYGSWSDTIGFDHRTTFGKSGGCLKLSKTDELLSNIYEYHDPLGFLNERYPKILNEWKLGTGPGTTKPNTNSITGGTNSNDRSNRDTV